ncbi:MAG: hypothetical protein UU77_C0004G0004 [candidate division WWE3 bacterium GW2011_GWC1_41_7]|uniref:Uncharacterized protein n=2 Tax=Katanobacteria TaxID=422282 RepID=A0A0G0XCQ7_UNCKA|nr:MAG: hypothetical protein UU77_C0004G0004 [candidate division WWE3 bacterium GW2011_GWC1_41_7]KKS22650.1 MAG: hypothetical protein UU80_C0004G0040 [candidate division WWE3 bacterium GW2011_GWA1_41_8]
MLSFKGFYKSDQSAKDPAGLPHHGRNDLRVHSSVRSDPRQNVVTRRKSPKPREPRKSK